MGASTHQSPRQRRADELAYVARCLTDRDRQIVEAVARFGVFTAEHIAEMFFDSLKRAQVRLQRLHALRVLDRFQPYRVGWGSSPYHYIIGRHGPGAVEADLSGRTSARHLALGQRRELDHVVAMNGLYVSFLREARTDLNADLVDWMTETEAMRWSDALVAPDAFGRWSDRGRGIDFFIELDRGGAWVRSLRPSLARYERFSAERGASAWVLVVAATDRREVAVRNEACGMAAPVATTTLSSLRRGLRWWRLGAEFGRQPISELPDIPPLAVSRRGWRFDRTHR